MTELLLIPYLWCQTASERVRGRLTGALRRARDDESGLDDSLGRLIWLGAAVAVGVAAVAFAITIYQQAKSNVPTPTPANPGP